MHCTQIIDHMVFKESTARGHRVWPAAAARALTKSAMVEVKSPSQEYPAVKPKIRNPGRPSPCHHYTHIITTTSSTHPLPPPTVRIKPKSIIPSCQAAPTTTPVQDPRLTTRGGKPYSNRIVIECRHHSAMTQHATHMGTK